MSVEQYNEDGFQIQGKWGDMGKKDIPIVLCVAKYAEKMYAFPSSLP
jgi:hypothetical protein